MIQKLIVYLIIALAILFIIYKITKKPKKTNNNNFCNNCKGCDCKNKIENKKIVPRETSTKILIK